MISSSRGDDSLSGAWRVPSIYPVKRKVTPMNLDDRFDLQYSWSQFERFLCGALGDMDESDIAITLVGGILLGRDAAVKSSFRAMEATLGPARRTPGLLLGADAWHPIAIVPAREIDCADVAETSPARRSEAIDVERTATVFHGRWRENREGGETEDGQLSFWQRDQCRPRRSRKSRPVAGWTSLTDSELRVAELVSLGLTNREVGQRMFLSRHTIDSHLRHIFDKLGIRSRVQLAHFSFAQSLSDP
jgi:DNA-binding CsgD family transcriptional regulator